MWFHNLYHLSNNQSVIKLNRSILLINEFNQLSYEKQSEQTNNERIHD